MYWEFHEQGGKQALRKGDWKLVVLHILDDQEEQTELYNLKQDPSEAHDVSQAHPEIVAEMMALLVEERVHNENFPFRRE
jgi:arylsulfatase A-like enzyme